MDYNGLLDYLDVCCQQMGIEPDFFQSNHEGDIIDEIQSAAGRADGIILNPGGYAYYSVAILEALQLCGVPAVEVLMSEPSGRERSGTRTSSRSAVRAALRARASAAISTHAVIWCSCSGWTAAHNRTWCSKERNLSVGLTPASSPGRGALAVRASSAVRVAPMGRKAAGPVLFGSGIRIASVNLAAEPGRFRERKTSLIQHSPHRLARGSPIRGAVCEAD